MKNTKFYLIDNCLNFLTKKKLLYFCDKFNNSKLFIYQEKSNTMESGDNEIAKHIMLVYSRYDLQIIYSRI